MSVVDGRLRRRYLEVIGAAPAHVRPWLQASVNQPSVMLLSAYLPTVPPNKLNVCGRPAAHTHRIDAHGRAAVDWARAVDVVAAVARGAVRLHVADRPDLLLLAPIVEKGKPTSVTATAELGDTLALAHLAVVCPALARERAGVAIGAQTGGRHRQETCARQRLGVRGQRANSTKQDGYSNACLNSLVGN